MKRRLSREEQALWDKRCAACDKPMYAMIRSHHHSEDGRDVTTRPPDVPRCSCGRVGIVCSCGCGATACAQCAFQRWMMNWHDYLLGAWWGMPTPEVPEVQDGRPKLAILELRDYAQEHDLRNRSVPTDSADDFDIFSGDSVRIVFRP